VKVHGTLRLVVCMSQRSLQSAWKLKSVFIGPKLVDDSTAGRAVAVVIMEQALNRQGHTKDRSAVLCMAGQRMKCGEVYQTTALYLFTIRILRLNVVRDMQSSTRG